MFGPFSHIKTEVVLSWEHTERASLKEAMKASATGKLYRPAVTPMQRILISSTGPLPDIQQAKLALSVAIRDSIAQRDLFSLARNNHGAFLLNAPTGPATSARSKPFSPKSTPFAKAGNKRCDELASLILIPSR